jgi:tetratricopeptide (TPR) repeat protein
MIGRTLLHYEVIAELGAGAMGRVFLARDTNTGRRVALKVLGTASAGSEARERLRREAGAAAKLSHPGIVTLYSFEEAEGELFLVQELVEGEDLASRLRRGPLGPAEVLRLARELAAALAHAHAHGVLHRDLKPENILIAADASWKIADFGIARIEGAPTMTEAGAVLGSLPYMAPERLQGGRGDARADLFALGAILYEAMSGRRAFSGDNEAAVIYAVMNEEPTTPTVSAGLQPLAGLVARLLAKEPGQRPSNAELVAALLAELSMTPGGPARPRANRWLAPVAGGALLLAAVAGAWWVRGHFAREPEAGGPAVAVLAFENVADPGDRTRMGAITGSLLITSLAQAPELNVLSTQRILDAMRQVGGGVSGAGREAALAVARRAHATRTITGSILQTEPAIVMTAEVADVNSGRVVYAERVEGSPGQTVFQVVDLLSARLLQKMARAGEAQRLGPLAQRTSTNLEAQRRYLEGLEQLSRGDYQRAIPAFEAALRQDPEFPQAHYQMAIAEWWNGEPLAAEASVKQAKRFADRLSPLERAIVEGLDPLVGADWSAAAERFEALTRAHPGDKLILYGLEEAAMHGRDWPRAVNAAREALAADPQFTLASVHLVDGLKELGRHAEAESTAVALLIRNPANRELWASRFHNLLRQGEGEGCERVAVAARAAGFPPLLAPEMAELAIAKDSTAAAGRWLAYDSGYPPWGVDGRLAVQAWALLRQGRFRESGRISERAWRLLPLSGQPFGPVIPIESGLAAALALRDSARAMTIADSMRARFIRWQGPLGEIVGGAQHVLVLTQLGHPAAARESITRLENLEQGRRGMGAQLLRGCRAVLLATEGHPREAIDEFEGSAALGPPWTSEAGRRFLRARFEMTAGRYPVALGLIDALLRAPAMSPDSAVRLHLYRAQCLEKLGRPVEAAATYREFLRIWKHADAGTPEVAEARTALARLERAEAAAAAPTALSPTGASTKR